MRSAIILAGGESTRMDGDKGLRILSGEPLVTHVVRQVSVVVDEVFLVVSSEEQRRSYSNIVGEDVKLLVDIYEDGSPLVGAITGFKNVKSMYALIVGCDMPFIITDAIQLLFRESEEFNGAVFEWPNGWIEPLIAVYPVEPSLKIALDLYRAGNLRIRMILNKLPNVRMIPVKVLREIDPELLTFYDADTDEALHKAEKMMEKIKTEKKGILLGRISPS